MVNEVVLALTQRKKNATENSRSGGSLGQGFRFSQLALSISCCFFSTPGNSAKNSPENAPFMQTSANHHSWTVQVISIRTISSLWGEFQPVVSALASFVSGSQDHFRLLDLADKLRAQPGSGIATYSQNGLGVERLRTYVTWPCATSSGLFQTVRSVHMWQWKLHVLCAKCFKISKCLEVR